MFNSINAPKYVFMLYTYKGSVLNKDYEIQCKILFKPQFLSTSFSNIFLFFFLSTIHCVWADFSYVFFYHIGVNVRNKKNMFNQIKANESYS